jgi:hypothetical protein
MLLQTVITVRPPPRDRPAAERRFAQVFAHLDGVQIAAPEELPAPSLDLDPDLRPRCHACHHRTARRCYSAGNAIVKACLSTGRLTRHYTKAQLRAALASIPASVKQYTNCPNVIGHALLSAR